MKTKCQTSGTAAIIKNTPESLAVLFLFYIFNAINNTFMFNLNVMKKFELNVVGLEPLKEEDTITINGGIIPIVAGAIVVGKWVLAACATAIAADIILNPQNTSEQFMEGYNSARK